MSGPTPSNQVFAVSGDEETTEQTACTADDVYSTKSTREKIFIVFLTSLAMIISMIGTNIVLPVLPILKVQYNVTTTQMNLLVTVSSLIQGLTPALMSTLSDFQGRRIGWMLSLLVYTAANIGLALQNNYVALIILRCLQSAGCSCSIPFGFAVVADISPPAERGRFIGPLQGCVMGAFAFGPVIGGLIEPSFGWRGIFWFLAIGGGTGLVLYLTVIPETARNIVGNGSIEPKPWWRRPMTQNIQQQLRPWHCNSKGTEDRGLSNQQEHTKRVGLAQLLRAFTILAEADALILVIFTSLFYYGVTALWASTGSHFSSLYALSTLEVGFAFLPYGVAGGIGSIISGKLLDANYKRIQRQYQHQQQSSAAANNNGRAPDEPAEFPYEVARLQVAIPFALLASISFIIYGWVVETKQSLAVVLVLQGLIGVGGTPLLSLIYTLLLDLYPTQAVATQGAADLVRCWLGAISAAVIDRMLLSMGWGWSFTFIGLTMIVALPLLGLVYRCGQSWREAKNAHDKRAGQ